MGTDVHFGTVKLWNTRGFGFIIPESGSRGDIFVHISNLVDDRRELMPDQIVQYKMGVGPQKTPQAVEVSVVKDIEEEED